MCGEGSGLILESPYVFGDSLNGVAGLDVNAEKKLITEKLGELREKGATEREIKVAMRDLGITRFVNISTQSFISTLIFHNIIVKSYTSHNILLKFNASLILDCLPIKKH